MANRDNDWRGLLKVTNAELKKQNVMLLVNAENDGNYWLDILYDVEEDGSNLSQCERENYAENYFEDELCSLINDAAHHAKEQVEKRLQMRGETKITREMYESKLDKLEKQMHDVKRQMRWLKQDYIRSNQPYPIGTKVRITYKEDGEELFGIVKGYDLGGVLDNEVRPIVAKVRKDGGMHQTAEVYVWWRKSHTIEVVK